MIVQKFADMKLVSHRSCLLRHRWHSEGTLHFEARNVLAPPTTKNYTDFEVKDMYKKCGRQKQNIYYSYFASFYSNNRF